MCFCHLGWKKGPPAQKIERKQLIRAWGSSKEIDCSTVSNSFFSFFFSCFFFFFFFLLFLFREASGLGVKLELQLQAYTTTTWQHWIGAVFVTYAAAYGTTRSLTHWARPGVWTHILTETSQLFNPLSHNPCFPFLMSLWSMGKRHLR